MASLHLHHLSLTREGREEQGVFCVLSRLLFFKKTYTWRVIIIVSSPSSWRGTSRQPTTTFSLTDRNTQHNTDTVVTGELSERKKREISPHPSTYTHGDCLMLTCEWRDNREGKQNTQGLEKRGQRTSPIKQKHTGHWRLRDRLLIEKQQQKVRKTISSFSCGHQTLTTKCRFV